MKANKVIVCALSAILLLSSCGMSNTAKGGLIGGGGGGALGALIGGLIGNGKGAAIGAGVGAAVGAGAGILIGNKMDKAKKAAEAANAKAEVLTSENGTQYVRATFDSGLLFNNGSSTLSATAQTSIKTFVTKLVAEDNTFDLAIIGFTDNQGFKGCTVEQSAAKNVELSQNRANAVKNQIVGSGYPASRIKKTEGLGEQNPVADNSTVAGRQQNRRVEVYIIASQDMINAANAQSK